MTHVNICFKYEVLVLQAMVEAGIKKPVVITWTPPQGHNVSPLVKGL